MRFLNRIKDLKTRIKLPKRAAEESWSTKETEDRVAKVLGKDGAEPRKSTAKNAAAYEYDYNGFHLKLIGDEVDISGRRFKTNGELPRQFASELQTALDSFLRDLDDKSARQAAAADGKDGAAAITSTEVAPSAEIASPEVTADLVKQMEEAAKPINELFTRITKANKEGGTPDLSDLLSLFEKPKSTG